MKPSKILIVDDELSIQKALGRVLRAEGYEVQTASSATEALELLRKPDIDLVLSDHMMPEMTGLELLKRVRDRRPDVGRVMLTGHADVNVALDAINEGEIHRFLTKPWDDTELTVVLYSVLREVEADRRHRTLLAIARRQASFLLSLRERHPDLFGSFDDADKVTEMAHQLLQPLPS